MQAKIQEKVCIYSLSWLLLANVIGLLISLLLDFPELNNLIVPLSYGRLVPLHLNFHLYGWCSIPLIGVLYAWYLENNQESFLAAKSALFIWSMALLLGGFSWLFGYSSGKIFLEWKDIFSLFFIFAQFFLWIVLYKYSVRPLGVFKSIMLVFLSFVPVVFCFVLSPSLFPPINFESSGATGASLMISTLAIIGIFLLFPIILKVEKDDTLRTSRYFTVFTLHLVFWLLIPHGNSSHYDLSQIIGLGSLLLWIPGLYHYYTSYNWPRSSDIWLKSFVLWLTVLFITAWLMFLPGILEYAKFSSLIVAHVHIAMAGMLTSFLMLMLCVLLEIKSPASRIAKHLSSLTPFYLWQFGLMIQLVSLVLIASLEIKNFGVANHSASVLLSPYNLRTLGGTLMFLGSVIWLRDSARKYE